MDETEQIIQMDTSTVGAVVHLRRPRVVTPFAVTLPRLLPTCSPCLYVIEAKKSAPAFRFTLPSQRAGRGISASLFVQPGESLRARWTGKRWIITRWAKRQAGK